MRRALRAALLAAGCSALCVTGAAQLAGTFSVPLDHGAPDEGTLELGYELGAPFDPDLPTVLAVADGQQFWVRPGAMARVQESLFGEGVNVVGVLGRARAPEVAARLRSADGGIDWVTAYRLLRFEQWVDDLEAVRRELLGEGRVHLYGRSGGALLVHQYLGRHGEHALRAFTQASVATPIEAELGVRYDRFWEEIDAETRARLLAVLEARAEERDTVLLCLQRQNFFVPSEEIEAARRKLVRSLFEGEEGALERASAAYQVDAVRELMDTDLGAAIAVRQYEFYMPLRALDEGAGERVAPSLAAVRLFAAPLIAAHDADAIPFPAPGLDPARATGVDVLVVAGGRDHTVDYRSQIALASRYARGRLLLLDDDHVFHGLESSGRTRALVQAWLVEGPEGEGTRRVLGALEPLRWNEWR